MGPALLNLASGLSAFPYLNPFLLHDALLTLTFLLSFFPAQLNLPGEGAAPFRAFSLKPHDSQASAFFRALDFKKLQFWSSVVKYNSDIGIVVPEKNLLRA